MTTPKPPFPEMRLPAPVTDPPMVLFDPLGLPELVTEVIATPWRTLPSLLAPVASVPMKLPWTRLPVAAAFVRSIPSRPLPEIRFRAASDGPPIVLFEEKTLKPEPPFSSAIVPVTSVPIKLPTTVFAGPSMSRPSIALPEITLRSPVNVPPIVLDVAPAVISARAVGKCGVSGLVDADKIAGDRVI